MLTRREITTLLFAFTVFVVAYNFQSISKKSQSFSPTSLAATSLLGIRDLFREDGRRVQEYVDDLERDIMGDLAPEKPPEYDLEPYGNHPQRSWASGDVPLTKVIQHVPGFTILENVFLLNATIFFVADYPSDLPKPTAMVSIASRSIIKDIRFFSRQELINAVGFSAHRLTGTSWMCFDAQHAVDNRTFVSLNRAYSTLGLSGKSLPPPDRTVFAGMNRTWIYSTGYDRALARLIYPFSGILAVEDLDDVSRANRPVYFDRVLIADRNAALEGITSFDFSSVGTHVAQAGGVSRINLEATDKSLPFAPAFALPAHNTWWNPVRQRILSFYELQDDPGNCAVTYVSTQSRPYSSRLRPEDHLSLVKQLQLLGKSVNCEIHIIELGSPENPGSTWKEHILAAVQSSVLLGVFGEPLTYSSLLRPTSPKATAIEFFPDGKYSNENEFITRSLDINYIAWRNTKKYPRGSLPPISSPSAMPQEISVDVNAVIRTIREVLNR